MVDNQFAVAEVSLRKSLIELSGTQFDIFKEKDHSFVREILSLQTANILNTKIIDIVQADDLDDILMPHKLFQPANIYQGFSRGDKYLSGAIYERIEAQFQQQSVMTAKESIEALKAQAKCVKSSIIENFILIH